MCVLINPLILFSDVPRRCIRRTTTDCGLYQLSHAECHLVAVEVVGLLAVSTVTEGKRVESLSESSFLTTKGVKRSDIEPSSKAMT